MKKDTGKTSRVRVGPGMRCVFNYPMAFTSLQDYSLHRGQIVTVIAPQNDKDLEVEPMWRIRAKDGWEGDAYQSELMAPGN